MGKKKVNKKEENPMLIFAWTVSFKRENVCIGEIDGKKKYRKKLVFMKKYPKIIPDGVSQEKISSSWNELYFKIERLLHRGYNVMGGVYCEDKETGQKGISVCSSFETKFSISRGIRIAKCRVFNELIKKENYDISVFEEKGYLLDKKDTKYIKKVIKRKGK